MSQANDQQQEGEFLDNYVMEKIQDDVKQVPKKKKSEDEDEDTKSERIEKPVNLLNDEWSFWYSPRGRNVSFKNNDYTSILKHLGSFNTIEDFFSFYCFMKRPSDIQIDHKICCFRKNARPTWEDYPTGGTWILMFRKQDHSSINLSWELLLLALIGEQFEDYNIVGILLSTRSKKNLIELWIKDNAEEKKMKIGEKLCTLLNIDMQNINLYFKNHATSLKESSTMRGAESFDIAITPYGETPMNYPDLIMHNKKDKQELEEFEL